MMMDRKRMLVAALIAGGLLFLMIGAILVDVSRTVLPTTATQDQRDAQTNLRVVWGPAVAHFGIFLFVLGLVAAALILEEMDVFVRLFVLIVAFVALLLVLAGSTTIFG